MFGKVKYVINWYEEVLSLPHKREIASELREDDDLFLFLLYAEMLGIPNPTHYFTLELYPHLLEKYHDWHIRMGMEKSPLAGFRCC